MKLDVLDADSSSHRPDAFPVKVAGPDLNFQEITLNDPKPTGRQIVAAAGFKPVEDFGVLQWLPTGDLEELRLNETTDLRERGIERFIIAQTDRAFFFELEGERQEWLVPFINGITLKRLGGKDLDSVIVVLEREDEPDREIDDQEQVDLSKRGLEKFKFHPVEKIVVIFVNGEKNPVNIKRGVHTGRDIKQTAIDQGVKIKIDFILSLEKGSGDTQIIGDTDLVKVKAKQHYIAVADDENS